MARCPTDQQYWDVIRLHDMIIRSLSENGIPPEIACSALMMASASVAAQSIETEDTIVNDYRRCLLDARARGSTMQ